MSNTKMAVLAFLLIALVLILTPRYLRWIAPSPEERPVPTEESLPPTDPLEPGPTAEPPTTPRPIKARALIAPAQPAPQRWAEKTHTIETDLYRAAVSSRGGGSLTSFKLTRYRQGGEEGNVQLITEASDDVNLRLSYINLDGDSAYLVENFEVLESPGVRNTYLTEGTLTLAYRYSFPSGARVTKRLTFPADNYTIHVEVQWEQPDLEIGNNTFEIGWPQGLNPAEKLLREDESYGKVYVYHHKPNMYKGMKLEKTGSVRKGRSVSRSFDVKTAWVAIRNKYFATAIIADKNTPGISGAFAAESIPTTSHGTTAPFTRYHMALRYNANQPTEMVVYLGPLVYPTIKELGVELERIMSLGWGPIRPIGKGVLYSLVALHKVIPNYGLVLILFAIIIRVITNPLTKKSALSTQKMQLIQPKVKALQNKYKGNPQKLNQEMMALWKSEGVNPFGGCLPILIQMPILFALFIVFRTTIELRGQPFAFWVTDLSAPDVVYTLPFSIPLYGNGVTILAIIMGLTMFIQQKISGAGANPQQKPMMYMMSGMFFLIFNQFPSGLNLYYAFSNILAIFQQHSIRKQLKVDQVQDQKKVAKTKKSR